MWLDSPARQADEFGLNPIREWAPVLSGLLIAGAISNFACSAPQARLLSWGGMVMSASVCVVVSFLAGATAAWVVCSIVPLPARVNVHQLVLKISCVAVWFAP